MLFASVPALRFLRPHGNGIGIEIGVRVAVAVAVDALVPDIQSCRDHAHASPDPHPCRGSCANPSMRDVQQMLQVGWSSGARSVRLV